MNKTVNNMEISTIKSNDSGVGFFIKVDGLTIFHSGDHANRKNDLSGPYPREINYLAEKGTGIDVAFLLSGAACGGGYEESVVIGTFYTIEKLSPKIIFPMHSGGNNCIYMDFINEAFEKKRYRNIVPAQFRGDRFFYKDGKIQ